MLGIFWKKLIKRKASDAPSSRIAEVSNVIQYDDMGYPLRLLINVDGKQIWRDTSEKEGDVVLRWEKVD